MHRNPLIVMLHFSGDTSLLLAKLVVQIRSQPNH